MSTITHSIDLSPQELQAKFARERVQIIDVREPAEYAAGRIEGSRLIPAGTLESRLHELGRDQPVVLVCRTGRRSSMALEKLRELGFDHAVQLTGGMDAWQKSALPVTRDEHAPWALERQVRLAAGVLILVGLIGSFFWPPAIALAWFVPCGLIFAALADSCAMGMLIAKMPWNRPRPAGRA